MKKRMSLFLAAVLLLLPSCGTQAGPALTPLDQTAAEAASFTPGSYENLTFRQDKISVAVPEDLSRCTLWEIGCFDLEYGDKLMRWWVLFPGLTSETAQWMAVPVWRSVLSQLAGAFFFGMVAALLPLLLAGVSKNACFILCAGFALFYVYCHSLDALSNRLFDSGDLERSFQVMMFYPISVFQCFSGHQPWRLVLWGGAAVLVLGLLRLCMARRFDKGA